MRVTRKRALAVAACALAIAFATPACSRATEADCKLIVDRSVELEMKESSDAAVDAAVLQKRIEEVRKELNEQIRNCQGRRVTEKTMACVRGAQTKEELEQCLR
jgi:hypothetical protein